MKYFLVIISLFLLSCQKPTGKYTVELYKMKILNTHFIEGSDNNPFYFEINILSNGEKQPLKEGSENIIPGTRGTSVLDSPIVWEINHLDNNNYQIHLKEIWEWGDGGREILKLLMKPIQQLDQWGIPAPIVPTYDEKDITIYNWENITIPENPKLGWIFDKKHIIKQDKNGASILYFKSSKVDKLINSL